MVGGGAQSRHKRRKHALGELGPVGEEVVQHGLVDAQDEGPLENGHRGGARLRHEHGELPDGRAGSQLDQRPVAAMHADATLDQREQLCLDRAMLDEHGSRLRAHLGSGLGDRREHAARHTGEQVDAVQCGDALDQPERGGHPPPFHVSRPASSCSSYG